MKGLFKQWNKRNLTPVGKIAVVKSLILPVLNHLFIALPNPSIEIIKDIEAMLYTFIWKSSVNRVKKDTMQKKYQEGGLKMINIHSFILALKSTWMKRLFFNNCKWQNIFMSSIDINKLSCGGSGYIEQVIESVKNQTLLTDDFQINVNNIASISLIISILGFGSAIKRWLSTGRISDLNTVILPIGVKFLLFHCLKSPFIFFKYFS
jgi:hypothetical protein